MEAFQVPGQFTRPKSYVPAKPVYSLGILDREINHLAGTPGVGWLDTLERNEAHRKNQQAMKAQERKLVAERGTRSTSELPAE